MKESKAMLEVWAWKAECDAEVAHLDPIAAVRKRLKDSAATAARFGFHIPTRKDKPVAVVAERKAKYGTK